MDPLSVESAAAEAAANPPAPLISTLPEFVISEDNVRRVSCNNAVTIEIEYNTDGKPSLRMPSLYTCSIKTAREFHVVLTHVLGKLT